MKAIKVNKNIIQDAVNIQNGVYFPLTGFLRQADYHSVLNDMRLSNGQIWSIPIVVSITEKDFKDLENEDKVKLVNNGSEVVLSNIEVYPYDKIEFAQKVYGTDDKGHPSVGDLEKMGDYLLGGEIESIKTSEMIFSDYNLTPVETKKIFSDRGWQTVAAFQTRNVPHRAHEFLQHEALARVDGLLIHPVIGEKKIKDFKDEFILSSYQLLIDQNVYNGRAMLGILPIKMHYAGPREAVMHALIRRNYGCSHFIVGRDHAGVGNFYHPTAAQDIFDRFKKDDLGIEILRFNEVVFEKSKGKHVFIDDSNKNDIINFSGTLLRDYINKRLDPPEFLIRPEVYNFLINSKNALVDNMYKKNNNKNGFVLWFTGFSAAGKTTIADALYEELKNNGTRLERLDGDVVRERLTKGLGFDRDGRNENILRIGFVANLLSRNGVGVMASFITPYKEQRDELRKNVHNYIEVFVDAPLAVCEKRDPKGMYKKARAGNLPLFTGVDDPYDAPENPDIRLDTDKTSIKECVDKVVEYLKENKYV